MSILPADRSTTWNPGLYAVGGIPTRTTIFTTLSPLGGGGDDTAQIQAAINACPAGQVVFLSAGTYKINTGNFVLLSKGITLRGAGPGLTILYKSDGATPDSGNPGVAQSPVIIIGSVRYPGNGPFATTNLSVDGNKADTSITVVDPTGFSVGDLVLLDELSGASWQADPLNFGQVLAASDLRVIWQKHNPGQGFDDPVAYNAATGVIGNGADAASWFCRQDRPQSEIKKIQSIVGNVVTFTTPLHISYRTAHTAQIQKVEASVVARAGVENLTLRGGDDGNLIFNYTDECWALNVESYQWLNVGIQMYRSFRPEIRTCYSHDAAWPQPGGGGYAIAFMGGSAECLVEDTISVMANKCIVSRCSGAGSVVGYCYMDDAFINTNGFWQEIGINASHMVGPHHVLFEGNWCFNGDSDHTHGNSTYMTYHRNYLSGVRRAFLNPHDNVTYDDSVLANGDGPLRCVGLMGYTYWCSFIGNVLGRSGKMTGWIMNRTFTGANAQPGIYMLGWCGFAPYPVDANVTNAGFAGYAILHGNYDYLSNAQAFDPAIPDHVIPSSYYLSQKPAAFTGGYTWPWVIADTGTVLRLPAFDRFNGIAPPTSSAGGDTAATRFGFIGPAGIGRSF